MKVINSLLGAGQMMFTKCLAVVSGNVDIRDCRSLMISIFSNTDFSRDILFCRGPLDVLDHSSDTFAFGGKIGIDATIKTPGEISDLSAPAIHGDIAGRELQAMKNSGMINSFNIVSGDQDMPLLILSAETSVNENIISGIVKWLREAGQGSFFRLIVVVDHTVDVSDYLMVAWQVLGNSDPVRDHHYISPGSLLIDGTIKLFRPGGFARKWPNIVCSGSETIRSVDEKWNLLGLGDRIPSPSGRFQRLIRPGNDEISPLLINDPVADDIM